MFPAIRYPVRSLVLNQELIGKRYPEQRFEVTAAAARAFALASNDENPRYLDDSGLEGPIAPPLFAIVAAMPSEILPLSDEALTGPAGAFFQKMVRGDNDILWTGGVIRPGDVLSSSAIVSSVELKSNGELLRVDVTLRRDGRELARVGCGYFVRGEGDKGPPKPAGMSPIPRGSVIANAEMHVANDQPLRYAEASGDRNPIHTDDAIARLAGHPGIILQGSCTMAFVAKAVVDHFCEGDPKRLRRLRVRYARPVLPGDTLTTIVWNLDDKTGVSSVGLETKKQDGTIVIKNAYADVAR